MVILSKSINRTAVGFCVTLIIRHTKINLIPAFYHISLCKRLFKIESNIFSVFCCTQMLQYFYISIRTTGCRFVNPNRIGIIISQQYGSTISHFIQPCGNFLCYWPSIHEYHSTVDRCYLRTQAGPAGILTILISPVFKPLLFFLRKCVQRILNRDFTCIGCSLFLQDTTFR